MFSPSIAGNGVADDVNVLTVGVEKREGKELERFEGTSS
jgi:hypothetical protein